MLYELIAIVRPGNVKEAKEIARNASSLILRSRGVIRGITNWGPFLLPKPTRAHQTKHHHGHYFLVRFDASAAAQAAMCRALKLDPRMIRFSVIKLAERLGTRGQIAGLEAVEGRVDWMGVQGEREMEVGNFVGATSAQAAGTAQFVQSLELD